MLRLFTGLFFRVVAVFLVFTGVDVTASEMFSDSEPDSSGTVRVVCFFGNRCY